jgi:hypothetical protein
MLIRIEKRVTGEAFGLSRFNDQRRTYDEIRAILHAARDRDVKIEGRRERPVYLRWLNEPGSCRCPSATSTGRSKRRPD